MGRYNKEMPSYKPFLNYRFDLAFHFASGLHRAQLRKDERTPYISHLMSVCALVLESGGDEDQAIAALLHDAVEDQGGLPTLDAIRRLFGDRVANAVRECSDNETSDPDNKAPLLQRKQRYLEHLLNVSPDALMISVADKLHNARTILTDYRQCGDKVWRRFNTGKVDLLKYYRALTTTFRKTSAPTAMVEELEKIVTELVDLATKG